MKKIILPIALVGIVLAAGAKKGQNSDDAVLMTVNGKDVTVGEFNYLYGKNNSQQAQPQTLDEYVDLFVNYKLKVADAEAAGIDTTEAFRKEYVGYCNDLASPFLTDSTVMDKLRHEAYDRMATSRRVSHIMLPIGRTPDEKLTNRRRLDSIRSEIVAGRAQFADMARQFSADRSAKRNGGSQGWIHANTMPYPFERAVYATPVGQISEVFDDAPYGIHIVFVEEERPEEQVEARHILKMTRGLDSIASIKKKEQIDSIYNVLRNGGSFHRLAVMESDDPGSGRQGGMLGWFSRGQMVPQFEEVAFALADSAVSEPFLSPFGYHIVQTLGHRQRATYDEALQRINMGISRDERASEPARVKLEQFKKLYGASLLPDAMESMKTKMNQAGAVDSAFVANMAGDFTTIGNIGNKKHLLVKDVAPKMPVLTAPASPEAAYCAFEEAARQTLDEAVTAHARENLAEVDPDFRNLVHEYRDGILLFEISNRNVWDRPNHDKDGLQKYFEANRAKYAWPQPRYKVIIISATNDSIAQSAKQWLEANNPPIDSIVNNMRQQFGRNVKVERKVRAQGTDAVVDYLGFGGEKPTPAGKWTSFAGYKGHMLTAPEEPVDAGADLVNDYQQYLEQAWLKELKAKYPVKINKKELKKLRNATK